MSDPAVDAVHDRLLKMSSSHRPFALPILRAIHRLGGSARKKAVIEELRVMLTPFLDDASFAELARRNRFGWTKLELKHLDLTSGGDGIWALSDLGRRYIDAHVDDAIQIPPVTLEVLSTSRAAAVDVDTVPVTAFRAYDLPILRTLEKGELKTKELVSIVGRQLAAQLLPGDFGALPSGPTVWMFRMQWALSYLGKAGETANIRLGVWAITEVGRQRLLKNEAWRIDGFPPAQASIVRPSIDGDTAEARDVATTVATKPAATMTLDERWARFLGELDEGLAAALGERLRVDRGPAFSMPRNIILYGPPGTGKTHLARRITEALVGTTDDDEHAMLVQFHPSYGYEDFVQGLRPDLRGTELRYALQQGPFLRIVEAAAEEPTRFHVLVIDEINRGDPARIFGELLFALEYRDVAITLAGGGLLTVPANLVIVGTMNSVDRSVALVDYALRRRFGFLRVDPDSAVIEAVHGNTLLGNAGGIVLDRFNEWLTQRLGPDHAIGHSYFLSSAVEPDRASVFMRLWNLDIHPLLEEYFFGDREGLREADLQWKAIVAAAVAASVYGLDGA